MGGAIHFVEGGDRDAGRTVAARDGDDVDIVGEEGLGGAADVVEVFAFGDEAAVFGEQV